MDKLIYNTKSFSIESGKYEGDRKRYLSTGRTILRGTAIGGIGGLLLGAITKSDLKSSTLLGSASGAFIGLIIAISNRSKETVKDTYGTLNIVNQLIENLTSQNTSHDTVEVKGKSSGGDIEVKTSTTRINSAAVQMAMQYGYTFDKPINNCDISVYAVGGHLCFYINDVSKSILRDLDYAFDDICHRYHQAMYESVQTKRNVYTVDFLCPTLNLAVMLMDMLHMIGIRVNFITEKGLRFIKNNL